MSGLQGKNQADALFWVEEDLTLFEKYVMGWNCSCKKKRIASSWCC
jgi:redox-regulated HSP33 family molecular chaperone